MHRNWRYAAYLACSFSSIQHALAQEPASLAVTVMNPGGFPTECASVVLRSISDGSVHRAGRAGADGVVLLSKLDPGVYMVQAHCNAYLSLDVYPLVISAGLNRGIVLHLQFGTVSGIAVGDMASISGVVIASSEPAVGVRVCVSKMRHSETCMTTDKFGFYSVATGPGDYELIVKSGERAVWRNRIVVLPGAKAIRHILVKGI